MNDPYMWVINAAFLKKNLNTPVEFNFAEDYTADFVLDKLDPAKMKCAHCDIRLYKFCEAFCNKNKQVSGMVTGMNMKTMEFLYGSQTMA